jgi:hypothetical protein
MRTEPIAPILAAVKKLLRGRQDVALPEQGIDLLFDAGVVARCRLCRLSWEVKRSQFSCAGWWSCPSGCRPRRESASNDKTHACSA